MVSSSIVQSHVFVLIRAHATIINNKNAKNSAILPIYNKFPSAHEIVYLCDFSIKLLLANK